MKIKETCSQGSFTSWGSGFLYEYKVGDHSLSIQNPHTKRAIARLKFDSYMSKDPLGYVGHLDKANKIKALSLSNDKTVLLTEIIDEGRIGPILNSTAQTSYCAHMLELNKFSHFSNIFVEGTILHNINIKKFTSKNKLNNFYVARAQTINHNSVSVRGCSIASLMAALSEKTLRDLITMEFGDKFQNSAHELLRISTKLSSISAILDIAFVPEKRLQKNVNELGENMFSHLPARGTLRPPIEK